MSTCRRTVLILDSDLAFTFWLGQALHQAGYDAFPAKSCEDATDLLSQMNVGVDLLIVDYALAGADAFADALRRSQSHLKVLAIVGEGEELGSILSEADASQNRPPPEPNTSRLKWLRTIEGLFVS